VFLICLQEFDGDNGMTGKKPGFKFGMQQAAAKDNGCDERKEKKENRRHPYPGQIGGFSLIRDGHIKESCHQSQMQFSIGQRYRVPAQYVKGINWQAQKPDAHSDIV
jgi:hypothetical protein